MNSTQFEPFEIRGHWWCPTAKRRVAGVLSYLEDDLRLELFGGLTESHEESTFVITPDVKIFPVIHGESLEGDQVKLLNCFYTKWKGDIRPHYSGAGNCKELLSSQLNCRFALCGQHLDFESNLIRCIRITLPNLECWLGNIPFNHEFIESDTRRYKVEYTMPDEKVFEIPDSRIRVRIGHSVQLCSIPGYDLRGQEQTIRHSSFVEVESLDGMRFEPFMETAARVSQLFELMYGQPLTSRSTEIVDDPMRPINVYYPRLMVKQTELRHDEFLIHFTQVSECFEALLLGWFNMDEDDRQASSIFHSSTRQTSSFMELRLLPLVHAIEILAKKTDSPLVERAVFAEIRKNIYQALPTDAPPPLIQSIKNNLGWANGHSLKEKTLKLLKQLHPDVSKMICNDSEKFVKGIVNTRNFYTHHSHPGKVLSQLELHWAMRKLSTTIRILLLQKIGLPEEILFEAIGKNVRIREELNAWRNLSEEGTN